MPSALVNGDLMAHTQNSRLFCYVVPLTQCKVFYGISTMIFEPVRMKSSYYRLNTWIYETKSPFEMLSLGVCTFTTQVTTKSRTGRFHSLLNIQFDIYRQRRRKTSPYLFCLFLCVKVLHSRKDSTKSKLCWVSEYSEVWHCSWRRPFSFFSPCFLSLLRAETGRARKYLHIRK